MEALLNVSACLRSSYQCLTYLAAFLDIQLGKLSSMPSGLKGVTSVGETAFESVPLFDPEQLFWVPLLVPRRKSGGSAFVNLRMRDLIFCVVGSCSVQTVVFEGFLGLSLNAICVPVDSNSRHESSCTTEGAHTPGKPSGWSWLVLREEDILSL
jgi:hypothetical protein